MTELAKYVGPDMVSPTWEWVLVRKRWDTYLDEENQRQNQWLEGTFVETFKRYVVVMCTVLRLLFSALIFLLLLVCV
jgi:hypothetical protein